MKDWVLRLWRGELELPRAFWDGAIIYGSLLNLVTSFAAFALLTTDLPAILAVAIFLSPAPYNLLTTIGVWRSASRYRGPAHWPTLARIAVIVWAIVATTI